MTLLEQYKAACDYPGALDEVEVERALGEYLRALGVTRRIVRLPPGWELRDHEPILQAALWVIGEFDRRQGGDARDALAALDARDARDARDALAARDARDARDALDARDAQIDPAHVGTLLVQFARGLVGAARGWGWWSWDLSWIATTHIGAQQLQRPVPWSEHVYNAFIAGAWCLFWTEDTLYWIAKPTVHVERGEQMRRLHCDDGPAVESDAENLYFLHGVLVPAFVVVRPDWITVKHIDTETNAEIRRCMMERYQGLPDGAYPSGSGADGLSGVGRYLLDSGAKPIDVAGEDEVAGLRGAVLYRREIAGDEPLVMVKLLNSTPEPDGRVKTYMIRVDPRCETARAAVAWTFDVPASEYAPLVET